MVNFTKNILGKKNTIPFILVIGFDWCGLCKFFPEREKAMRIKEYVIF